MRKKVSTCLYPLWLIDDICVCFPELLRNIRTQVLIKLIKPYTRIHIPFISKVSTQHPSKQKVTLFWKGKKKECGCAATTQTGVKVIHTFVTFNNRKNKK